MKQRGTVSISIFPLGTFTSFHADSIDICAPIQSIMDIFSIVLTRFQPIHISRTGSQLWYYFRFRSKSFRNHPRFLSSKVEWGRSASIHAEAFVMMNKKKGYQCTDNDFGEPEVPPEVEVWERGKIQTCQHAKGWKVAVKCHIIDYPHWIHCLPCSYDYSCYL